MIARKLYYLFSSFRSLRNDKEQLRDRQINLLKQVLDFACSCSDFYQDFWKEKGFEPEEVDSLEDLEKAPVLRKEVARENMDDLKTDLHEAKKYSSSGTTGSMATVGFDEQAADWREALTLRTEFLKGYTIFESIAGNWGKPKSRTGKYLRWFKEVPEESSLEQQVEIIREAEPEYLVYGGHVLFEVAREMKLDGGFKGDIKGVFNNGELLTPNMRDEIERVFDAPVHSVYETAEFGQIAWGCPDGGYHINQDLVHVEILDDGEEVEKGEAGSLVVTGLVNRCTPLIRYEIGDIAVKVGPECNCDTGFRKIERLEGRKEDIVRNSEGDEMYPRQLIDALARIQGLKKFQFVREDTGYKIRYVPNRLFDREDKDLLQNSMRELGFEDVVLEEVDDIPRKGRKAEPIKDLTDN